MSHWLLDTMVERYGLALREADRVQLCLEAGREPPALDEELVRETLAALEIAVLDLAVDRLSDDDERRGLSRQAAADAFRLVRMLPLPTEPMAAGAHLLRASVLAVLGDRGADTARWLRTLDEAGHWPVLQLDDPNWGVRCRAMLIDVWLLLMRNRSQNDRDAVLERVAALRDAQEKFERDYSACPSTAGSQA